MNIDRLLRKFRYHWFDVVSPHTVVPADVDVDIVIPVTAKDLSVLPLAIEGVRRNVPHRISAIYIVARRDEVIEAFCDEHGLVFVDEREVMGYGPGDVGLMVGNPPRDRSGWLFQQLLKLSGRIGTSPYFITIDADHILLRPHTFVSADGRLVFYRSKEHHRPYFDNMQRLAGIEGNRTALSYVAHKMVFDRALLARLRGVIEQSNPGMPWDKAILASIDRNEMSGFSEFELYGNFVPAGGQIPMPFRNHHLRYGSLTDYDSLRRRYASRYAAVTFPDYLG